MACWCGKVVVRLQNRVPRFSLLCGCFDCKGKIEWTNRQDKVCLERTVPDIPELVYLDSDILGIQGEEYLKVFMLRKSEWGSPFCVATCCYTVLLVDNPYYDDNVVMVIKDGCVLDAEDITPAARIFMKDYEKRGVTPTLFDGPSLYYDERDPPELWEEKQNACQRGPKDRIRNGESASKLFSRLGEFSIINWTSPLSH